MSEARITLLENAALEMDWQQVVQNGGPPCFHLMDDGTFCGRAERWPGHDVTPGEPYRSFDHPYVSLFALIGEVHHLGMEDS